MAAHLDIPTTDELADLLATMIAGVAGGSKPAWRKVIGPVQQLPTWSNVRCNWSIAPRGSAADCAVVEQAVAIVRDAHPYVESPRERTIRRPTESITASVPASSSKTTAIRAPSH